MMESIHYTHDVVLYVPCFYSMTPGYPSFTQEMSMASEDLQMVYSLNPDYILVLTGKFDAKTQPYDKKVEEYNKQLLNSDPYPMG